MTISIDLAQEVQVDLNELPIARIGNPLII